MGPIFFCIQGYVITRNKNELICEKYNTKMGNEKWRHVLDVCQEGIAICNSKKVMYHNKGLLRIISENKITSDNIEYNVIKPLKLDR